MFRHIQKSVFGALTSRRSPPYLTAGFRAKRHNRDLCPDTTERIDVVLARVERHFSLAYDIQGPRDGGVDVLVRLSLDKEPSFIGFQLKSDEESGPNVYQLLKAQWADAVNEYKDNLLDYYVILGWDQKDRATQIRFVEQAMHGLPGVHVIEPAFAWSFLYNLPVTDIEAIVRRQLSEDDPLLAEAKSSFLLLSPPQAAILCSAVATTTDPFTDEIPLATLANSEVVRQGYSLSSTLGLGPDRQFPRGITAPPGLDTRLGDQIEIPNPDDLDALDDFFIDTGSETTLKLDRTSLDAVLALAYEGRARWRHEGSGLEDYLFALVVASPQAEPLEGEQLADLAIIIGTSDLDDERMQPLLTALLRHNFESVELCCDLLGEPDLATSEGWNDTDDPFAALAVWMLENIVDDYYDGREFMSRDRD